MEAEQRFPIRQRQRKLQTDFVLEFTSETPGADHFAWAMQAIDTALVAGVWMEAMLAGPKSPTYRRLKGLEGKHKIGERFFPGMENETAEKAFEFIERLDPFDPLDTGVLVGLNAWLRSSLSTDPEGYRSFETLAVEDARRESPIVLVLALPLAVKGIGVAAAGAYGVLKSVDKYYAIKKKKAETEQIKRLTAAQARESEATTRKLEIEAEMMRIRLEGMEGHEKKRIAADLEAQAPKASGKQIEMAASIGTTTSAVVVQELERNQGVERVKKAKRDGRLSSKSQRRKGKQTR